MKYLDMPSLEEKINSLEEEKLRTHRFMSSKITEKDANLSKKIPVVDVLCVEADSGGDIPI